MFNLVNSKTISLNGRYHSLCMRIFYLYLRSRWFGSNHTETHLEMEFPFVIGLLMCKKTRRIKLLTKITITSFSYHIPSYLDVQRHNYKNILNKHMGFKHTLDKNYYTHFNLYSYKWGQPTVHMVWDSLQRMNVQSD